MIVGYMGDIVFSVSASHVLTPSNFSRESEARWTEHSLLLKKPVSQFGGPGLEKVSFDILLSSDYGISPTRQLKKLRKMRDTGAIFSVVIGGLPLAQNSWRLDSLKESDHYYDALGLLRQCTVSLSLTEYEEGNLTEEKGIKMNFSSLFGGA